MLPVRAEQERWAVLQAGTHLPGAVSKQEACLLQGASLHLSPGKTWTFVASFRDEKTTLVL